MDEQVAGAYKKPERFTQRDIDQLKETLGQIRQFADITWEFTEDYLTVVGLDDKPVSFGHWRSAKAGLEMFLVGYDQGFRNGRFYEGVD